MFGLSGFLNILLLILLVLVIIGVIITILYLLLPYIFRWFACDKFEGSYEPKLDNLVGDTKITEQDLIPKLILDKENHTYRILFGENREFTNGKVTIHYNNTTYSNFPSDLELKLDFLHEVESSITSVIGPLKRITWFWQIPETNLVFESIFIQSDSDFLIFEIKLPQEIQNLATGDLEQPIIQFPCFKNQSYNKRVFTFQTRQFSTPTRDFKFSRGPVLLFDDNKNTVLISALNQFSTSGTMKIMPNFIVSFGPNGTIEKLPAEYTHQCIILFHKGINKTFQYWGEILQKYYHAKPTDRYADVLTSKIGYFTDNGAIYYYKPLPHMKMDQTLIEVKKQADKEHIPFQYYQLDSWWYEKSVKSWQRKLLGWLGRIVGGGLYGGTFLWEPDKTYLDLSLPELYEALGKKPFAAHNRWYSSKSPYVDKYHFYQIENRAMPKDYHFWEYLMDYCKKNHIEVYEQDWMSTHYLNFPKLYNTPGFAREWLKHMAESAARENITIQYCMAPPQAFLHSIEFENVTNFRSCEDYAARWPHRYDVPQFMQTSMLTRAIGKIPFKDTYIGVKQGRINGEREPVLMALISNLSTGPVGPGSPIDGLNSEVNQAMCRNDGLLFKPDRPITATDLTYIKNDTYYICSTESKYGDYTWFYILTINLWPRRVKRHEYYLEEIDIEGNFVEFDWFSKTSRIISSKDIIEQNLKEEKYKYRIYSPILMNGCAILGDLRKFVTMNDLTFGNIELEDDSINMQVTNISGEKSQLIIYSPKQPTEILIDGENVIQNSLNDNFNFKYDSSKNWIELNLHFETDSILNLEVKYD